MRFVCPALATLGTNGPIMDDQHWDNADFVKAVEATGRKTLVIAGVWTRVCVAFPALQAKADGYQVYAVMDASGDMSERPPRSRSRA